MSTNPTYCHLTNFFYLNMEELNITNLTTLDPKTERSKEPEITDEFSYLEWIYIRKHITATIC